MYNKGDPKYSESVLHMKPNINDLNICLDYLKTTFNAEVKKILVKLIKFALGFLYKEDNEYDEIKINEIIHISQALDFLRSNRKNCGRTITFRELDTLRKVPTFFAFLGLILSKVGIAGIEICDLINNPDVKASFNKFFYSKYIKV